MIELDSTNLTGIWQGYYLYQDSGLPVPFVATLLESGRFVTGTTHEIASRGRAVGQTLYALVDGTRNGANLCFVKQYSHSGENSGYEMPVQYEGLLSADGSEVEGQWMIHAGLYGRFAMIRPLRTSSIRRIGVETPAR